MGFLKGLGSFAGKAVGTVVGGGVKVVGEVVDSKFIREVGDGIDKSSQFMGDRLGETASGVYGVAEGIITKDDRVKDEALDDLASGIGKTAKGVATTIQTTAKNVGDIGGGLLDGDDQRWKQGARELGKTAAVVGLGVAVIDIADGGVDSSAAETPSKAIETTQGEYTLVDNPNAHFVEPHWVEGYERADGTYVEGYWRDGDGDTSINVSAEEGGGWTQSSPSFREKV